MAPACTNINIERVENGWVIHSFSSYAARREGFLPEGTQVALTPDQLTQILHEWASKQQDMPKD